MTTRTNTGATPSAPGEDRGRRKLAGELAALSAIVDTLLSVPPEARPGIMSAARALLREAADKSDPANGGGHIPTQGGYRP